VGGIGEGEAVAVEVGRSVGASVAVDRARLTVGTSGVVVDVTASVGVSFSAGDRVSVGVSVIEVASVGVSSPTSVGVSAGVKTITAAAVAMAVGVSLSVDNLTLMKTKKKANAHRRRVAATTITTPYQ
jgi:hypothetical protein